MNIRSFFQAAIEAIQQQNFSTLSSLQLDKPAHFNWVEDIFFPLNVQRHGDSQALIWRYQEAEKVYSFGEMYRLCNQLVNFLRKHGRLQGDRMYTVLPLIPENWISFLATIKGGYIIMPTATNLTREDLVYRFGSLLPEIMIAEHSHAEKIDEAEAAYGGKIQLKIIVGGQREGWHSFEQILQEDTEAEAASNQSR